MEKQCFKCKETKPLSEFYIHPQMGDGRLNKCITCTKRDVAERVLLKSKDRAWVKKERERHRKKQARYRAIGTAAPCKQEYRNKWAMNNPDKIKAHRIAATAKKNGTLKKPIACESCGKITSRLESHHDDYSKPLEVRWLCPKCHGKTRHKDDYVDIIP